MSVEIKRSSSYSKNESRCHDDEVPCAVCGRPVKDPWPHWIHIGGGGGLAVTDEEAAADPTADLGAYPVGSRCWKQHPELHPYGA
jgi:hypothetical protein